MPQPESQPVRAWAAPSGAREPGVAAVVAFYGTDVARITAAFQAVGRLLQSDPIPERLVFVEAQRSPSAAVFRWLSSCGVDYVFKAIPEGSDGLLLKTALWNVGAAACPGCEKLVFLDSDFAFDSQSWLSSVAASLGEHDVVSPAGYVRYEGEKLAPPEQESIGHAAAAGRFSGHIGMGIGMTREAYALYGGFEAFSSHDDSWIWSRILGTDRRPEAASWIPYAAGQALRRGLPLSVGSTEERAAHLPHGGFANYDASHALSYRLASRPFCEIKYDRSRPSALPEWSLRTDEAKLMKACLEKVAAGESDPAAALLSAGEELFGRIDRRHPLVATTVYCPDYAHRDPSCVLRLKSALERLCGSDFTFVCFSPVDIDGVDVVRHSPDPALDWRQQAAVAFADERVSYPKCASVAFFDLDAEIPRPFRLPRCRHRDPACSRLYSTMDCFVYFKA